MPASRSLPFLSPLTKLGAKRYSLSLQGSFSFLCGHGMNSEMAGFPQWVDGLGGGGTVGERDDPGTVSDLVAGVELFVIAAFVLPHLPKYLQPALAQASQGTGVALALPAFLLIVGFGPGAFASTEIGP